MALQFLPSKPLELPYDGVLVSYGGDHEVSRKGLDLRRGQLEHDAVPGILLPRHHAPGQEVDPGPEAQGQWILISIMIAYKPNIHNARRIRQDLSDSRKRKFR
ncbi:MAG: hypothetical protein ACE5IO_08855 [Thermoplasmata archaeon]